LRRFVVLGLVAPFVLLPLDAATSAVATCQGEDATIVGEPNSTVSDVLSGGAGRDLADRRKGADRCVAVERARSCERQRLGSAAGSARSRCSRQAGSARLVPIRAIAPLGAVRRRGVAALSHRKSINSVPLSSSVGGSAGASASAFVIVSVSARDLITRARKQRVR